MAIVLHDNFFIIYPAQYCMAISFAWNTVAYFARFDEIVIFDLGSMIPAPSPSLVVEPSVTSSAYMEDPCFQDSQTGV